MSGSASRPDQDTAATSSFERLAAAQLGRAGVGQRRMFGRDGLTVHSRFYAFRDADLLLLKLPPSMANTLIAAGQASTAISVSRTMTKWVAIPLASGPGNQERLLDQARQYTAGDLLDTDR